MDKVFVYPVHVTKDDPCFQGHFPNFPVFPAVAQIKLLQEALEARHHGAVIISIPVVKFVQPILPNMNVEVALSMYKRNQVNFSLSSKQQIFSKGTLCYRVHHES